MFNCCLCRRRPKTAHHPPERNATYTATPVDTSSPTGDGTHNDVALALASQQTANGQSSSTIQTVTHSLHNRTTQEVKIIKSGNTSTVMERTTTATYSKVVPLESEDENRSESAQSRPVYNATALSSGKKSNKFARFTSKILPKSSKRSSQPDADEKEYQQHCLFAHNRYRLKHNVMPLALNADMCKEARDWAKHLAKKNRLKHNKKTKFGENVALLVGENRRVEDAVKLWYDEISKYDYSQPENASEAGHFSQLVWKATAEMGVGMVKKGNSIWIVCNYYPTGNIVGEFKLNVLAPRGDDSLKRQRTAGASSSARASYSQVARRATSTFSPFELECLEAHNELRQKHGSRPMTLSATLCSQANEWAKHLAKIRCLSHRQPNQYGENLYQSIGFNASAKDAVQSWYAEIKNYKFSKPQFAANTGHFTQLVWTDSTELGAGIATIDNVTFIVCNYNPPGNVMGEYKNKVPPLGGFPEKK